MSEFTAMQKIVDTLMLKNQELKTESRKLAKLHHVRTYHSQYDTFALQKEMANILHTQMKSNLRSKKRLKVPLFPNTYDIVGTDRDNLIASHSPEESSIHI